MGQVKGDLDLLGIENLFQALASRKGEGFLVIQNGEQSRTLEISSRGLRVVSGGRHTKPLGQILVKAGKITSAQLDEFLAEQRQTGMPLGEIVAGHGIVSQAVIHGALCKQVAEEVHDLFTWTGATFEFTTFGDGEAPPDSGPLSSVVLDGSVMSIMLEAARRIDELEQIRAVIPDERLVPVLLELPGLMEDTAFERNAVEEIVPIIDGERTVGAIIDASLFPQFTVLRTLYGLALAGIIKIKDRGDEEKSVTVLRRPPQERRTGPKGRTVLLLTDTPAIRRSLPLKLLREGYEVLDERPTADLAKVASRQRVDAVFLEAPLGTPEGEELCRRVREAVRVPFIVLTGSLGRTSVLGALDSGAKYVLLQPFDEKLVVERLNDLLSR